MIRKICLIAVLALAVFYGWGKESNFPRSKKNPREFRVKIDEEPFKILNIWVGKKNDNLVLIDFAFNRILNPASVNQDSVKILDGDEKIKHAIFFSKNGKSFRAVVKNPPLKFTIEIDNVKSNIGESFSEKIENATENWNLAANHFRKKN